MQRARSLERLFYFTRCQKVETVFQYLKKYREIYDKDTTKSNWLVQKFDKKKHGNFGTTARSAGCRFCLQDITAVRAAGGSVSFIRRPVRLDNAL